MMLLWRALLLFIFLGLIENVFCNNSEDAILQFCRKHNMTVSELEDEANQAGISVEKLIGMMNAEYPSPLKGSAQKSGVQVQPESELSITDFQTGNEDVLGFIPSSSVIYSSDMSKNATIEEPSAKTSSEGIQAVSLDTETLKLSENTLFIKKGDREMAEDVVSKSSGENSYSKPSKPKNYRVLLVNKNSLKDKVYYKLVQGDSPNVRSEVGKRYYIVNKDGQREEYRVVEHRPRLIRAAKVANYDDRPQKVKIIRRHIQPLIIAQPNIAPLHVPMQIPQMPGHPGYVVPPQIPPQIPPQAPPQAPPMNPQTRNMDDFDDMNRGDNYRSNEKNSFIGPMTISIIVIILIICCIIGGFCFCGANNAKRNHENMPLIPPRQNAPQQPLYNSRAPIVPQNQQPMQPPQGRQVFGYAVIPNIQ